MNGDSNAILALCSHLCVGEGVKPLEPAEWRDFAELLKLSNILPNELFDFSIEDLKAKTGIDSVMAERIIRLIDRNASLSFELGKYENMGIFALTRADKQYPKQLKMRLGNNCPPVFYYAGSIELTDIPAVGYVGSRAAEEDDIRFTMETVAKTFAHGFGVVSGGAKGIDTAAEEKILALGGTAVEYLADSMLRKMRSGALVREIQSGHLLLLSAVTPEAGFNVGTAMMRNRFIYAQSEAVIAVRSEYNKGGTWAGATDNIKRGLCPLMCRSIDIKGNRELIKMGAYPIDETWDGDIRGLHMDTDTSAQQISMFD